MAELDTKDVQDSWACAHVSAELSPDEARADFDAWHRKELAKAWEEGCLAGRNRAHHRNMTPEQAEVAFPNPYKEA